MTAAEIAQSVGLTERTFFRHFSDKREVLFDRQHQFFASDVLRELLSLTGAAAGSRNRDRSATRANEAGE